MRLAVHWIATLAAWFWIMHMAVDLYGAWTPWHIATLIAIPALLVIADLTESA